MHLKTLINMVRRLRFRITKQPKLEGQPVLLADRAIDNLLAENLEDQKEIEELLGSILQDRIEEIQDLNESLRSRN